MEREYSIIINAKAAHHPSQDEIFKAIRTLVDIRVKEFPKSKSGTEVSMMPVRARPRPRPTRG